MSVVRRVGQHLLVGARKCLLRQTGRCGSHVGGALPSFFCPRRAFLPLAWRRPFCRFFCLAFDLLRRVLNLWLVLGNAVDGRFRFRLQLVLALLES